MSRRFRVQIGDALPEELKASKGIELHGLVKRRMPRQFLIRRDGAVLSNGVEMGRVEPVDDRARAAWAEWIDGEEYL